MNEEIKHFQVKQNFKYPEITSKNFRFGSGQLGGEVLRQDGDWRDFLPPEEDQNKGGVESSACYVEASQHAIATIQEEQYGLADQNYSARFNTTLSNGGEYGGDPLAGAESMRTDGLILESLLPFSDAIQNWQQFHSFVVDGDQLSCIEAGKEFLKHWQLNYDIVFERNEPVAQKYIKLREALKRSPVPMSVAGWYQNQEGTYIKPIGVNDNHLVLCVYLDEQNRPYFWDTYSPYLKIGEPFYNSDFSLRWSVSKKMPGVLEKEPLCDSVVNWFKRLFSNLKRYAKPA